MTKRETIDTGNDKHYVRCDDGGKFKENVVGSRSLSMDARHDAKDDARSSRNARGDQKH
jgi:hypothetical protein